MPTRRDLANAIRALSMDAVQQANSGHPGMPMGMADIAEVLWRDYLRHNPVDPRWPDRDRFVLSNGHGTMLQYSLLHLSGYALPMDEIKRFRQLGSMTPGHPEYGATPGVETTTGPLGQGIGAAVGMALAEKLLAARFNRPDHEIVDHYTYVFLGDGCLMEGLSHEACSLAGTLKLGKLICFYDDNGISIDGEVDAWFGDDTPGRFHAYGWHVVADVDGHDSDAIGKAIEAARAETDRPTLICCKTIIGWGAPTRQGTAKAHGEALGDEEIAATRERLNWPHAAFQVPADIYQAWDARERGQALQQGWNDRFAAYAKAHPELAAEFERRIAGKLPENWAECADKMLAEAVATESGKATRKSSGAAIEAIAPCLPELIGGSADLTGSNNTNWSGTKAITAADMTGNYLHYGVREFAMAAIENGLTVHGGFIAYGGTFLTFSDYARNAMRLAALMKIGSIFVMTHDSIGLGEDGPTHQPIEHVASLRIMPGMSVWRPADSAETAAAWQAAIERRDRPTTLALTRQNLPQQQRDAETLGAIGRGGYILVHTPDTPDTPDVILIATGSEVQLAVDAAKALARRDVAARVVSMPSTDVFDAQDAAYREQVLPAACERRVAIEAGVTNFWYRYVGARGRVIGIDHYGESAPAPALFEHFGFTVDNVIATVEGLLSEKEVEV
ncbi:transketolase [Salinisphaera sp.]|uniref:transketolase n=1 Tax=Salinisphaera sp. TaxID=1914330 RepID=UPI002D78A929|nr:transketolase [Salinisphaera sp.]HET7314437.1 transketolase [Salinisphaera sp.]